MVGIFSRFSASRNGHRRTQSALVSISFCFLDFLWVFYIVCSVGSLLVQLILIFFLLICYLGCKNFLIYAMLFYLLSFCVCFFLCVWGVCVCVFVCWELRLKTWVDFSCWIICCLK